MTWSSPWSDSCPSTFIVIAAPTPLFSFSLFKCSWFLSPSSFPNEIINSSSIHYIAHLYKSCLTFVDKNILNHMPDIFQILINTTIPINSIENKNAHTYLYISVICTISCRFVDDIIQRWFLGIREWNSTFVVVMYIL